MDISVRNLTGNSASLTAKPSETIGLVRRAVQDEWNTKCILRLHLRVRSAQYTTLDHIKCWVACHHACAHLVRPPTHACRVLHSRTRRLFRNCTCGQESFWCVHSHLYPACCHIHTLAWHAHHFTCRLLWSPRSLARWCSPHRLPMQSHLQPLQLMWHPLLSLQQQQQPSRSSP